MNTYSAPGVSSICLPEDPIPPGFGVCISHEGEMDCPTEPRAVFTERHIFYKGVKDDRQCSACTCGAPVGSACTAAISIYKGNDLTCSGPALDQKTVSSTGPTCIDILLPGQALGSKSAGPEPTGVVHTGRLSIRAVAEVNVPKTSPKARKPR